jgi:hypothetical protein
LRNTKLSGQLAHAASGTNRFLESLISHCDGRPSPGLFFFRTVKKSIRPA